MKTIHKIAAMVIKDNKFIMVRKFGKDTWTSLGGRLEEGESEEQCLLREIKEEVNCDAKIIRKLGNFEDKAAFDNANIKLSVYITELIGEAEIIDNELEEFAFIGKDWEKEGIKLTKVMKEHVIPYMIKENLLDW
ncbi:MAG: NUDIX domain-containing protein [Candidatus Aenigmarchaeota archaeon]|nr:NUDIX domain-containing protein [Candidatus Aenigmarchaeota archaeon]